jgi:hypothetical protein
LLVAVKLEGSFQLDAVSRCVCQDALSHK